MVGRDHNRKSGKVVAVRIAAMAHKGVTQTDSTKLIREDRDR
jgi:hypothetical protein